MSARLRKKFLDLIRRSDSTFSRIVVVFASGFWGLSAFLLPEVFSRRPYEALLQASSGVLMSWHLGGLFVLHFVLGCWRLVDPRRMVKTALSINAFGFVLWGSVTTTLAMRVGFLNPGLASEWAITILSGWILFKTGLPREALEP